MKPRELEFLHDLIDAAAKDKSWRQRLQWVRDRFMDPAFAPTPGQLATVAAYLRLLATGALRCEEDGRHFRPNHHAEAAAQIETALERLSTPATAWILRRIYPYLPAWGDEFRRAEPLTRIRDIAHRNDIPRELKDEIKRRLQNKLHRCAGPEDLGTSAEILQRIASGGYAPDFVREFQTFHAELQEFFNATALNDRLETLGKAWDAAGAEAVRAVLSLKAKEGLAADQLLDLLERLADLRRRCTGTIAEASPHGRSQLRLADIGLEDYAFTVLSECANRLVNLAPAGAWTCLLRALQAALEHIRLSMVEPEECAALRSELVAWAVDFSAANDFHLTRLMATLARARRLAETYTDRINGLFAPIVAELGRALEIKEHALKVFSEGDIRGHVIFQLSRLVDIGLQAARQTLRLPPWEAIVPGSAVGRLVRVADLAAVEAEAGPLLLLLAHVDGNAEIPLAIKGIILGHPLPHLSHLSIRARQARIPLAVCVGPEHGHDFEYLVGKQANLRVTPEGVSVHEVTPSATQADANESAPSAIAIPAASLDVSAPVLSLDQADVVTCGAKAAGAQRLLQLAAQSGGLFRAPRGLAIPFGVLSRCLDANPALGAEYRRLQQGLEQVAGAEIEPLLERLRALTLDLQLPDEIGRAVSEYFGPDARLAVRSSANGEDLEHLAGAGLYDSVINVHPAGAGRAIAQVWASLWTRRAALSRIQAGIPHTQIHMAVLVQELVVSQLCFVLHTVNPHTGNRTEALAELAVGLGEVLASATVPGTPYRLVCNRQTGAARLSACASFSFALRPAVEEAPRALIEELLDYAQVPLSADEAAAPRLGKRLAAVATFLEETLGRPQDVEGVCVGEEIHIVQARPQQGL
jgi:phosphoglucan,water dikinase